MADNSQINIPSTLGDLIRDKDRAGVKTQIMALDLNPAGAESLMAGTMPVSILTDADNTSSGTLAAALQTVVLVMGGKSAAGVVITGTWVGTITFEGTVDGTTWGSINAVAASTSFPQPTTTVNGLYRLTPAGLLQMRAIMTLWTSGTASISMRASAGTGGIFANQILPSKITDGTNTVTIKPASTASAATDLPFVVALHPSSPTPNFLAAQTVTGTRLNNGTSNASGSTHLTIGGSDGTNLKPLLVDVGGRPLIKITDGTNSAGITAAGIAGSEITVDRLKVNASLRMIDTAQAAGSQLVAAKGDQTTGLWVNIKNSAIPVTGTFFQATQPISATNLDVALSTRLKPADTLAAVTTVGAVTAITNALPAGTNAIGNINELRASNLAVTVTAATGTAATLTLPAVAGQFHYITSVDILLYSTAARTGSATPTVVTSTNLPGAIAFTFSTAAAIGTTDAQDLLLTTPLKSSVVNTATTIVAPIAAGGIWRITATYFTGA